MLLPSDSSGSLAGPVLWHDFRLCSSSWTSEAGSPASLAGFVSDFIFTSENFIFLILKFETYVQKE